MWIDNIRMRDKVWDWNWTIYRNSIWLVNRHRDLQRTINKLNEQTSHADESENKIGKENLFSKHLTSSSFQYPTLVSLPLNLHL